MTDRRDIANPRWWVFWAMCPLAGFTIGWHADRIIVLARGWLS